MAEFLEERLYEDVDYGSSFMGGYMNQIYQSANGNEFRSQLNPFIKAMLSVDFERQTEFVIAQLIDLHNRAGGQFRGFRVMHPVDYSTNNYRDTVTAFDQHLPLANPSIEGTYQLTRWYGDYTDTECARRRIKKPVAGTVLVGVAGIAYPATQWSVSNTTGVVTMAANKTGTITGITQAASAVVTAVNTLGIGETVHFSGVVGMTQINGLRGTVTAATGISFTVNINSAGFTAYSSGGTFNTRPQTGELVTAGCKFDIPMRFDEDMRGTFSNWDTINAGSIGLTEILNP